ncbi:hypothetical protein ACP70R_046439 [Stipagrostis hirtigluma subsp. patula]
MLSLPPHVQDPVRSRGPRDLVENISELEEVCSWFLSPDDNAQEDVPSKDSSVAADAIVTRDATQNKGNEDNTVEEEAAKRREEEEEAEKKWKEEEEAANKRKEEEEAAKKLKEDEEAAKKWKEEEAAKRKNEEAAKKRKEEEEAAMRKKQEQEEADKRKQQQEEEARKKKQHEEEARKKKQQQEEEAAKKKQQQQQQEARKKKQQEEEARKKQQQEEEEEARKKQQQEEEAAAAAKLKKEETVRKRRETLKRKKEEADKKKEQEEAKKKTKGDAGKKKKLTKTQLELMKYKEESKKLAKEATTAKVTGMSDPLQAPESQSLSQVNLILFGFDVMLNGEDVLSNLNDGCMVENPVVQYLVACLRHDDVVHRPEAVGYRVFISADFWLCMRELSKVDKNDETFRRAVEILKDDFDNVDLNRTKLYNIHAVLNRQQWTVYCFNIEHQRIDVLDSADWDAKGTLQIDHHRNVFEEKLPIAFEAFHEATGWRKLQAIRKWKTPFFPCPLQKLNNDCLFFVWKFLESFNGECFVEQIEGRKGSLYRCELLHYLLFHPLNHS